MLIKKTAEEGQAFETYIPHQIKFYNLHSYNIQLYIGHWRLVTFRPEDAIQKSTLHFLKFYFIFM